MFTTLFGKRKLSEDVLANMFVNAIHRLVDQGFECVAEELNEAPEFSPSPGIQPDDDHSFLLIVLSANLMEIPEHLPPGQDRRLFSLVVSKFAHSMGISTTELEGQVRKMQSLMKKVNTPSKNTVYAMGKVLFNGYELFQYQDAYFRDQRAPNPIILQRLYGLMECFLWDWQETHEQFRITN